MNHVIALLQFREIDVQQRPARLGVGRFEAAGALHLVAPKNLRVGHHHQFGRLEEKAPRQRADANLQPAGVAQPVFPPNLLEPLALAVVVAENHDRMALARPSVQLPEEFLALRLRDVRLWRPVSDGPENLQPLKAQGRGGRRGGDAEFLQVLQHKVLQFARGDRNHAAPRQVVLEFPPGDQEWSPRLDLGFVTVGLLTQHLRFAQ